jgi:hypothetical protein
MSPREIIGLWLPRTFRHVDPGENTWDEVADDLLKALDEQGMAVVPKDAGRHGCYRPDCAVRKEDDGKWYCRDEDCWAAATD